jgi:hypothetical protein
MELLTADNFPERYAPIESALLRVWLRPWLRCDGFYRRERVVEVDLIV